VANSKAVAKDLRSNVALDSKEGINESRSCELNVRTLGGTTARIRCKSPLKHARPNLGISVFFY